MALISVGLYLFSYFDSYFNPTVELVLNLFLIIFLAHFIWNKIRESYKGVSFNLTKKQNSQKSILQKTLGFSLLNPHVYSDTVFFIGNISKSLEFNEKLFFGLGASMSSIIFFFTTGYLSRVFSEYLSNERIMKKIDLIIIFTMSFLVLGIVYKALINFCFKNFCWLEIVASLICSFFKIKRIADGIVVFPFGFHICIVYKVGPKPFYVIPGCKVRTI